MPAFAGLTGHVNTLHRSLRRYADMGTLLDEARTASRLPGPTCDIERIALPHARADEILELIRDRSVSHAIVVSTLERNDIWIGRATVERHRKNACVNCRRAGRTY